MSEPEKDVIPHERIPPLIRVEQEPHPKVLDATGTDKPTVSDEKIYEETAKVIAIFWEWRDKTLSRYFLVTGGVIAVAGWLFQQFNGIHISQSIPLFAGSVFSYISYRLDDRHKEIFLKGYCITADLELQGRANGAIYKFIRDLHKKPRSLTQILRWLYLTSSVLFFVLSIVVFVLALYRMR